MFTLNDIDNDLYQALTWHRPAQSQSEDAFVFWLKNRIADMGRTPQFDNYGNLYAPNNEGIKAKTLFVAHTDTASYNNEFESQTPTVNQPIAISPQGIISLRLQDLPIPQQHVLGADDGAGIALAIKLMAHNAKADFVFFRDEEIGCLGSQWAAHNTPQYFEQYQRIIALDRRGTTDIISHQLGKRTATQDFCQTLANAINQANPRLQYQASGQGICCDSLSFAHLVPNCTNISVGYDDEHSHLETLDYAHWLALKTALIGIDWQTLSPKPNPV